jgi:hypothetical protein
MAVGNFSVSPSSDLLKEVRPSYSAGWYEIERNNTAREFRWTSGDAKIQIFNPGGRVGLKIIGSAWNYSTTRKLSVQLNGSTFFETYLPSEAVIDGTISLPAGYSDIAFHSTGCSVPRDVEKSEDPRCLSVAFANLSAEVTP